MRFSTDAIGNISEQVAREISLSPIKPDVGFAARATTNSGCWSFLPRVGSSISRFRGRKSRVNYTHTHTYTLVYGGAELTSGVTCGDTRRTSAGYGI